MGAWVHAARLCKTQLQSILAAQYTTPSPAVTDLAAEGTDNGFAEVSAAAQEVETKTKTEKHG